MKAILLTTASVCIYLFAASQSQGPFTATNFSNTAIPGSSASWINMNNAAGSDDQYATFDNLPDNVGDFTDYLEATGFNFTIPLASTINGVVVEIENSDPNKRTSDYLVSLTIPDTEDRSTNVTFNADDETTVYGSDSDLWGDWLDPEKINEPTFGVKISLQRVANGGATLGRIDNIRITVYYTLMILPVRLISFSAFKNDKTVKLEWTTAEEQEFRQFEIERSTDGRVFSKIATIPGRNTNSINYYSADDPNPAQKISYYRLRLVHLSGDQQFSNIIPVHTGDIRGIQIYPNPGRIQKLFIDNPEKEEFKIQFYNYGGKLLTTIVTSSGEFEIPARTQVSGMVMYRVCNRYNEIVGIGRLQVQ